MNNFGLSQQTLDKLLNYFKTKDELEKVVIYGSRAKGNYRTGSDIDFAIWSDVPEIAIEVSGELEDLPTPYKFDVIDYKTLSNEALRNSINNDGILFYSKS